MIVGVGAEIRPIPHLSIVPTIQLPLLSSPVRYGPIIGLGLRGTWGGVDPLEADKPGGAPTATP
jgi:hypothetical protein